MRLDHRIDFMLLVSVSNADPNGDPLRNGMPRTDGRGYGIISPVCIKRKLRDRLAEMGEEIFVAPPGEDCGSLSERAALLAAGDDYSRRACQKWYDVRAFGQIFMFQGVRCPGVRGAVTIQPAFSVDPVEIVDMGVTRCIHSDPGKRSAAMGRVHMVKFGLYVIKGSVNALAAGKNGFSAEDAEKLRRAMLHLFDNDSSAARPAGSMEVRRLYWWEHKSISGEIPAGKVFRTVILRNTGKKPLDFSDYQITHEPFDGLVPVIYE